jgi:hypothetical protein
MKNNFARIMLASFALVGLTCFSFAQDSAKNDAGENAKNDVQEEKEISRTGSKITGTIGNIAKNSIAVVYKRDEAKGEEFEMLFPIDKNLKIVHKKSVSELSVGDTVEVQYEDVVTERKGRQEGKRNTAVITFISPGETVAEPTRDTNTTVTNNDDNSVAPLKSELR